MSNEEARDTAPSGEGVVKKEKRNRWGALPVEIIPENLSSSNSTNDLLCGEVSKKARASRWSSAPAEGSLLPENDVNSSSSIFPPVISLETTQQTMILKLKLQQINEQLMTVVQDAAAIEKDPCRSPSPPPKYDSNGKRLNTREMRMRENLSKERIELIEEVLKLNPQFTPPADFIKGKPVRRIYIPKQANPLYNYIGLIIGPRGNTQKQMELETGCKISIRGKGSAKDGSKGRLTKNADEDDELHCHITGDFEDKVEMAAKMVEALLQPMNEGALNVHKEKQLRELALINGTLREDEYCPVCGEKGHRQFECPHRAKAFKSAGVKCSICGDLSHPTRDCPMKLDAPTHEAVIDTEYDSFLSELNGNKGRPTDSVGGFDEPPSASAGSTPRLARQTSGGGPTIVAPVVNLLGNRAKQTIIRVTSVMTGYVPPTLTSALSSAIQMPPMDAYGSNFAPSLSAYAPVPPQYAPQQQQHQQYVDYSQYGMYGASVPIPPIPYGVPMPLVPQPPPPLPFGAPLPPVVPLPPNGAMPYGSSHNMLFK